MDAPPVIALSVEKEEMCVILAPCTIRAQTHPPLGIGPNLKCSNYEISNFHNVQSMRCPNYKNVLSM